MLLTSPKKSNNINAIIHASALVVPSHEVIGSNSSYLSKAFSFGEMLKIRYNPRSIFAIIGSTEQMNDCSAAEGGAMSQVAKQEKYLTVQALTQYIKRKFDADPYMQKVFVIGEISNFRLRPNGHQYFSLKDDKARIGAVMYRGAFSKLPFKLEEGMKVLAQGRIAVYEPNGNYQLIIEQMEPDGIGAYYLALEQLKEKLRLEGALDRPKRPIVRFPRKIAVITSPTGAVIRDIITTVKRRYPIVALTVFPTRVQGKEAVGEIVRAFQLVEAQAQDFDTIILARGGGSIEDLWSFNEEAVARAILASSVPVISSIGHETDTTIADLVADLRAPTPTAAAEQAVPVLTEVLQYIQQTEARIYMAMNQRIQLGHKHLERLSRSYALAQPERLYQPYQQRLDQLMDQLQRVNERQLQTKSLQAQGLSQRLLFQNPKQDIQHYQQVVSDVTRRLARSSQQLLKDKQAELAKQAQLLNAVSPLQSLARGYAVVEQADQVVKGIKAVAVGQTVDVRLVDGSFSAKVEAVYPEPMEEKTSEKE